MFETFDDPGLPKPMLYDSLARATHDLVVGESDAVANMANVAALVWSALPDLNWAGFYRLIEDELVLGPFIGKPACVRIGLGRGVCGTAAALGSIQIVPDVSKFKGHISCDADSVSELVVPVMRDGKVVGVIDLDSPLPERFDEEDARGMELIARIMSEIL